MLYLIAISSFTLAVLSVICGVIGTARKSDSLSRTAAILWAVGLVVFVASGVVIRGQEVEATAQTAEVAQNGIDNPNQEKDIEPIANYFQATPAPEPDTVNISDDDIESLIFSYYMEVMESALKDGFGDDYNIMVSDNVILVNTWKDGITRDAITALNGNEEALKSWNDMVAATVNSCEIWQNNFSSNGLDYTFSLNILNDVDNDRILLSTVGGVMVYDAVNDNF